MTLKKSERSAKKLLSSSGDMVAFDNDRIDKKNKGNLSHRTCNWLLWGCDWFTAWISSLADFCTAQFLIWLNRHSLNVIHTFTYAHSKFEYNISQFAKKPIGKCLFLNAHTRYGTYAPLYVLDRKEVCDEKLEWNVTNVRTENEINLQKQQTRNVHTRCVRLRLRLRCHGISSELRWPIEN